MDGKVYVIIARKGAGKSTFIEEEILTPWGFRKNYILNFNNEYKKFKNAYKGIVNKELFFQTIEAEASQEGANSNIILEEADSYCRKRHTDGRILNQLTRTWHTKNIVVFVFHSILAIPKEFFASIDFWVIYQTQDDPEEVKKYYKGRKDILNKYLDVYKKTLGTGFDRSTKTYPDERSKNFWHYNQIVAP